MMGKADNFINVMVEGLESCRVRKMVFERKLLWGDGGEEEQNFSPQRLREQKKRGG
jgi:hypothetical protein